MNDQHWLEDMAEALGLDKDVLKKRVAASPGSDTEEALREMRIVKAALGDEKGQAFVRWLMAKTVLRPPTDEELTARSAEALAILSAQRNGERQIIFMIASAMLGPEETKQPEPEMDDEDRAELD